jgi:ParB/RepB/Spo0J family partition protein
VADCSATLAPRGVGSDQAADEANGLRIASLMELETWCGDDWPDCEYWRCVASAAAVELGGLPQQMTNYVTALAHLRQRRNELMQELRHDPGYAGLKDANDQAQQIIADEINHFLFQQYEETHMPTGTKAKPRKTEAKKPDPIVEMLNKPWHPKSQRHAMPGGEASADEVSIDLIMPSHNPRQVFNQEAIEQLAESIKANGILQALLVAPPGLEGRYELIAGERRLRAAKLAGLTTAPVRIVEKTDQEMATARLAENLLREDLNPIEEALGYQDMLDRFASEGLTQKALGEQLGRSQAHISNRLRLLKVPEKWRNKLIAGEITDHHIWALVPWSDRPQVFDEVERLIKDQRRWTQYDDPPGPDQFRAYVETAVLNLSRPLKTGSHFNDRKQTWRNVTIKPTEEQREQLDLFEFQSPDKDHSKTRAWNIPLWEKLAGEQVRKQQDREAKKAETAKAAAKSAEISPEQQKQRAEQQAKQYAKKLYRWKVGWLQTLIGHQIESLTEAQVFHLIFLFAINPETGDRFRSWSLTMGRGGDYGHDGSWAWTAMQESDAATVSRAQSLLEEWFAGQFEGYHADTPPALIEAVAAYLDINQAKCWKLTEEFLGLHTSDQLRDLATKEWGLKRPDLAKLKRGELIDWLMTFAEGNRCDLPNAVLKCSAVSLR